MNKTVVQKLKKKIPKYYIQYVSEDEFATYISDKSLYFLKMDLNFQACYCTSRIFIK